MSTEVIWTCENGHSNSEVVHGSRGKDILVCGTCGLQIKHDRQPCTFFDSYHSRLHALALRHDVSPESLKGLIEDAFGKCDTPPAEKEAEQAIRKLAKMQVGPTEINWLFQYHIV